MTDLDRAGGSAPPEAVVVHTPVRAASPMRGSGSVEEDMVGAAPDAMGQFWGAQAGPGTTSGASSSPVKARGHSQVSARTACWGILLAVGGRLGACLLVLSVSVGSCVKRMKTRGEQQLCV